jgi:hypothetical protein
MTNAPAEISSERIDDIPLIIEVKMGRHLIRAYELPTEVARADTSSFNALLELWHESYRVQTLALF